MVSIWATTGTAFLLALASPHVSRPVASCWSPILNSAMPCFTQGRNQKLHPGTTAPTLPALHLDPLPMLVGGGNTSLWAEP